MPSSTSPASPPKVVIIGRSKDTANYEKALQETGAAFLTTMDIGRLSEFDALLLPGGGDITPAFFGQRNQGSKNIDIELDITQLQAMELFVRWKRPVLGICKGMQVINVYFGGTIIQHIKETEQHAWEEGDKIHPTVILPGSYLAALYRDALLTNSAHHQAVGTLGKGLLAIQHTEDGVIEGIAHETLPVLGVQWHPERQFSPSPDSLLGSGKLLFSYFLSLCPPAGI